MTCAKCSAEIPEGANFCAQCGTPTGDAPVSGPPAATSSVNGIVPQNPMVPVPARSIVLRSSPRFSDNGEPIPLLDVRGTWDPSATFVGSPLGKFGLKILGAVFLTKGERGVWPAIRGPLGELASELITHHAFGWLGTLALAPEEERIEADAEEGFIKEALDHPATVVIPAPLVVNVEVAKAQGKVSCIRVDTADGHVFSVAPQPRFLGRPFPLEGLANHIWLMRVACEYWTFYVRQLMAYLPDGDQKTRAIADVTGGFFHEHEVPEQLRKRLNVLLEPSGRNHELLHAESYYHLQRFRTIAFVEKGMAVMWHVMDNLPEDYYPLCFHCGIKAPRARAKYCTKCGLWMW